ncbi:zinc finger CCCH domain-containing protein 14 [Spodoptera litura]|uniref:Zinc finger CCCH domain-containing protein 14 n=1 Tax=Spodoptera litura TaxID=69820 RepID=A0A9J7EB76_SPOLT|nr:zinc finger CCCH domain-containing protein 14 [Spodoptera litura]
MDVVGSEIGQKMRSAIKAKLTELGCYVDDELPDYVMVMVANKRTRAQMEDDLQLFLGDNTELFVNWLHQVLKKLQEVTVATPLKTVEREKSKERSDSKERKSKEKKTKDKQKKSDVKKSKKKDKEKLFRKKDDKKIHKTKKKSKHHDIIRPNIPPLLMNMEKESEPSITDVFAGQILKNHGVTLEVTQEEAKPEKKPVIVELKRPILPIIDPATISSQPEQLEMEEDSRRTSVSSLGAPKEDQIKEINQIEAKIQGLKQKLAEQLDSMSDDEDFLNIRTEAEELMNDFAEDVFQEISQQAPQVSATVTVTPPMERSKSSSPPPLPKPAEPPKELTKDPIETLPQIELKLPKRPVRDRLGIREEPKKPETKEKEAKRTESPERFTPEREPNFWPQNKSAKSRLGEHPDASKRTSVTEEKLTEKPEPQPKKLTSKVSVLENRPSRSSCASVVRVRPRPRVSTPANSLLLRAVADAHKSLLNAPPKVDTEPQIKRALVLPMRRCVEAQKIVIQVPADTSQMDDRGDSISLGDNDSEDEKSSKVASDVDREEYIPAPITKKIINSEYTPSKRNEGRTASRKDDTLIIETINIHNPSIDKDKNTQFIVTMDGYHPNAFLAKKLLTEGLLSEEDEIKKLESSDTIKTPEIKETKAVVEEEEKKETPQKKRLSNSSAESDTQVIIKKEDNKVEKRKSTEVLKVDPVPAKKRRASPIVFDVDKKKEEKEKEPERVRERTESASSDQHVTVATVTNTHKYDSVPPLSAAERKLVWCRAFPSCRYGAACAFSHPRCKFAAACTRRHCGYSHAAPPAAAPAIASHVVPAANYKTISAIVPNMCKFYPNCVNPTCHYYHPKPCRYGKACINKLECNFYHADVPAKWRYPV